uniref:Uncharacterized protein n=1 Tax=Anguilla anguilla TaxID=7936 RepID=A0A0E9UPG6_ANGAN
MVNLHLMWIQWVQYTEAFCSTNYLFVPHTLFLAFRATVFHLPLSEQKAGKSACKTTKRSSQGWVAHRYMKSYP